MSVSCIVAYALWILSVALMVFAWRADNFALAGLAMIVCGAAVTATIRTYFISLGQRIKAALIVAATEQQEQATVRKMR